MAAQGHEPYEALAVAHVSGELRADEAAQFRAHLVSCRSCRLRVAELRDIAAELAATERDERRRAATVTETQRRSDEVETDRPTVRVSLRAARVTLVVVVIALAGLSFWNFHLRRVASIHASTIADQERVLAALTSGRELATTTAPGILAVARLHQGVVAISASGVSQPGSGRTLVLWETDVDGSDHYVRSYRPTEGRLLILQRPDHATGLLVTIEDVPVTEPESGPTGTVLITVTVPTTA